MVEVDPDFVAVEEPLLEEEEALAQISAETVAVLVTSSAEQALTRQGVTEAVMAALPVVHWQFTSVRLQDVEAIAVAKQETEQAGKSAIVTA